MLPGTQKPFPYERPQWPMSWLHCSQTWASPKQIVNDQGTGFIGKTLKALAQLVVLQALHTTIYHPQTNGLVDCFNGTLKRMLRKFVPEGNKDSHVWLPFLLFAPFELLYGRHPRGLLDVVREDWGGGGE